MARHLWLDHPECLGEIAHTNLSFAQEIEQLQARRIAQTLENKHEAARIPCFWHTAHIRQIIYLINRMNKPVGQGPAPPALKPKRLFFNRQTEAISPIVASS